jgi:hypothetical protein
VRRFLPPKITPIAPRAFCLRESGFLSARMTPNLPDRSNKQALLDPATQPLRSAD